MRRRTGRLCSHSASPRLRQGQQTALFTAHKRRLRTDSASAVQRNFDGRHRWGRGHGRAVRRHNILLIVGTLTRLQLVLVHFVMQASNYQYYATPHHAHMPRHSGHQASNMALALEAGLRRPPGRRRRRRVSRAMCCISARPSRYSAAWALRSPSVGLAMAMAHPGSWPWLCRTTAVRHSRHVTPRASSHGELL